MKYKVSRWCRDCYNEDPLGCFGGGMDYVREYTPPFRAAEYDSINAAYVVGWEDNDGPWAFRIEDEDGNIIYTSGDNLTPEEYDSLGILNP